jgi:polyhydroxyalkanoate synthesis regulator phasin
MRNYIERGILASVGLFSMTQEKAKKIVDELIQRGEIEKDEAKDWVENLVKRGEEERQSWRNMIHDEVKSVLDEFGLATKQDLQDLTKQIEETDQQTEG